MKIIVAFMLVFSIACNTLISSTAPEWSEAEAIAVVKDTCEFSDCYDRTRELFEKVEWVASYQQQERRWVVTLRGTPIFGGEVSEVVSYAYENTKTVEWHVNR